MELVNLRAFATVAEYGSLRKAAEALYVAESTVSRQIKALEDEIHVGLFTRAHKNLQITDAGKKLLPEAQRIIKSVGSFERAASGLAKNLSYTLSVGYCGLPYEEDALVSATKALRRDYQSLSIMLEIDRTNNLIEKIREGTLDLVLLYDGSIPDVAALRMEHLGRARSVVMLPKAHRLAHCSTVSLSDLEGESILFEYRDSSPLMYDAVSIAFKEHGLTRFERVYTQDYRSIPAMVATGQGIALSNAWMENPLPKSISIKELREPLETTCVLLWLAENENPMIEPFCDVLKLYFDQTYAVD